MRRLNILKEKLKTMYVKDGLTTYDIAKLFGCCQGTIWKRLQEYGIKTRWPWNAVDLTPQKLKHWYVKQRLSTWKIEKRYGYRRGTIHRKLREFGIQARNLSQPHIIYPRKSFDGILPDKAYLIGFRIGDLRVRKLGDTIHVDCGSTKNAQIKLIKSLLVKYGNVWVGRPDKRGAVQIEAALNTSFDFLLSNAPPAWVFSNNKYFFPFLAGFTDAEGCVSIAKRAAYYSLGNYNRALLARIQSKLLANRISCGSLQRSKIKGRPCFGKYFHKQNYWQLSVRRKKSLLDLFNELTPFIKHLDKISAIKKARENIFLRNKLYD